MICKLKFQLSFSWVGWGDLHEKRGPAIMTIN